MYFLVPCDAPVPTSISQSILFIWCQIFCNKDGWRLASITLPGTNQLAPENGWLIDLFLLGPGLFSGAFAVSFREGNYSNYSFFLNSWELLYHLRASSKLLCSNSCIFGAAKAEVFFVGQIFHCRIPDPGYHVQPIDGKLSKTHQWLRNSNLTDIRTSPSPPTKILWLSQLATTCWYS